MVHEANARPSVDGAKVGGHQASSASVVSLLTALYFKALRPGDVVATKAHAAPAFYAIQFLRGRLDGARLTTLREFGGLQAYPSRRKNPDLVDLSTGSMGLGAVMTTFGALATRYLVDHGGARAPERFVVMVGDAELDEGNVWEALGEEPLARLGDVLWIVDVNRQSLDRVIPDGRPRQLAELFRAHGWRVRELRWGGRLEAAFRRPGGERLRRRLEAMPGREYQRLLRLPPGAVRQALGTPPPRAAAPAVPHALDETYEGAMSTQEAFGRVLGALARRPEGEAIVTVSADVAVTTHLAGWINRTGVYGLHARPDPFADAPQAMAWRESPSGRHIELGIAEHNLFLLLGALGLTAEVSGTTLLPIGTLYDPFVPRGLDALYHALYAGGRFVVAATPSGVTLSPEGGAHQSVITPSIGVALPAIAYFEPSFAREVEWILLDGLAAIAAREGESLYLRLSTRAVDQALAPPPSEAYRDAVLRGGYRLSDARAAPAYAVDRAVHVFAAGVMVTEALAAARLLAAQGVFANVFVVTSPDRLYRGLRAPRPWLETLVAADEEDVPVVSVLDGHSHALGFLGSALGVPQQALGVEDFGQSGARADLYRHYGIDAAAIVAAARTPPARSGCCSSRSARPPTWRISSSAGAAGAMRGSARRSCACCRCCLTRGNGWPWRSRRAAATCVRYSKRSSATTRIRPPTSTRCTSTTSCWPRSTPTSRWRA